MMEFQDTRGTAPESQLALQRATRPQSVAIVGVSSDPLKYGSRLAKSVVDCDYPGELHFVNANGGRFLGRELAPSLSAVGPVDLVIVSVPGAVCPDVVAEAAGLGCGSAVVVATGFSETGQRELERDLGQSTTGSSLRIVGPNCMGIFSAPASLNAMGDPTIPHGRLAVVAQSGIVGMSIYHRAKQHRLGLSYFLSVGNQLDLGFEDICGFLAEDDQSDAVLMYVEGFRELPWALASLAALAERVPVAVLRGGRSAAGATAAASHTAAIAGDDDILSAALREAGVTEARSESDLMLAALAFTEPGRLTSRSVSLVSDSGGFATLGADAAVAAGLLVDPHPPAVQEALREVLLPQATVSNPVDMIGGPELREDIFERAVDAVLSAPEIAGAVMLGGFAGYGDVGGAELEAREVAAGPQLTRVRDAHGKPFVLQTIYAEAEHPALDHLRDHGVPVVDDIEDAMRILAFKAEQHDRPPPRRRWATHSAPASEPRWLEEDAGRGWLAERLSFAVPEWRTATGVEEAAAAAAELGGSVVLKLLAPGLLHRSDVGGVELDLRGRNDVLAAWERLAEVSRGLGAAPRALVVRHVPGMVAAHVGVVRHGTLGPVVVVGSGGVYVEDLADRALLFPPFDAEAIAAALQPLALGRILGSRRADPSLARAYGRLAQSVGELALRDPELYELDLNPVLLAPDAAFVVDVRVGLA
jgi:acetyltransferase